MAFGNNIAYAFILDKSQSSITIVEKKSSKEDISIANDENRSKDAKLPALVTVDR